MNYSSLTNEELLANADNKNNRGALVPIAQELAERLATHRTTEEYNELAKELQDLKTRFELDDIL